MQIMWYLDIYHIFHGPAIYEYARFQNVKICNVMQISFANKMVYFWNIGGGWCIHKIAVV